MTFKWRDDPALSFPSDFGDGYRLPKYVVSFLAEQEEQVVFYGEGKKWLIFFHDLAVKKKYTENSSFMLKFGNQIKLATLHRKSLDCSLDDHVEQRAAVVLVGNLPAQLTVRHYFVGQLHRQSRAGPRQDGPAGHHAAQFGHHVRHGQVSGRRISMLVSPLKIIFFIAGITLRTRSNSSASKFGSSRASCSFSWPCSSISLSFLQCDTRKTGDAVNRKEV
jgi:hypothetical protein